MRARISMLAHAIRTLMTASFTLFLHLMLFLRTNKSVVKFSKVSLALVVGDLAPPTDPKSLTLSII